MRNAFAFILLAVIAFAFFLWVQDMPTEMTGVAIRLLIYFILLVAPILFNVKYVFEPYGIFAIAHITLFLSVIRVLTQPSYDSVALLNFNGLQSMYNMLPLIEDILSLAIISWLFLDIGYFVIKLKAKPAEQADTGTPNIARYIVVYALIGIGSWALFVILLGGDPLLFLRNSAARRTFTENEGLSGTYYLQNFTTLIGLACLIWFSFRQRVFLNIWFVLFFVITCFVLFSLGARSNLILFIVNILLIFVLRRYGGKAIRFPYMRTAAILVVLIGIALVMLSIRQAGRTGSFDGNAFRESLTSFSGTDQIFNFVSGLDFVDVDILMLVWRDFPSRHDFINGSSFVSILAAPIPRQLWPDKPVITTGGLLAFYSPSGRSGYPPSYLGELYINFGVLGVVVGFLLMGVFLQYIRSRHINNLSNTFTLVRYTVIIAQFVLPLTLQSFSNAMLYFLYYWIPLEIMAFMNRRSKLLEARRARNALDRIRQDIRNPDAGLPVGGPRKVL